MSKVCEKDSSSSPKKSYTNHTKRKASESSIIGYVHNLSPIKRNRKDNFEYASFKLQTTEHDAEEALLYSPSKRKLLEESQISKTPIKLVNYTRTDNDDKVVVNDMTFVGKPQPTEYSFQNATIPEKEHSSLTILEVLNELKEWDTTAVTGKITKMTEPTTVGKRQKPLRLAEAVLTDSTGSIPVDVWEENISQLTIGQTYKLTKVQVKVWSKKKKISTTPRTEITPIEDESLNIIPVQECPLEEESTDETVLVKEILTVEQFDKHWKCLRCNKKIQHASSSNVKRCLKCGLVKTSNCELALHVKFKAKSHTGEECTFTVRDDLLGQFLQQDISSFTEEDLAEALLYVDNDISITHNTSYFVLAMEEVKGKV